MTTQPSTVKLDPNMGHVSQEERRKSFPLVRWIIASETSGTRVRVGSIQRKNVNEQKQQS